MSTRLVAGVDCSTQSTKVLVVDVENGEIKGSGKVSHDVYRSAVRVKQIQKIGGLL